jgi:hypothetical protein
MLMCKTHKSKRCIGIKSTYSLESSCAGIACLASGTGSSGAIVGNIRVIWFVVSGHFDGLGGNYWSFGVV